MEDYEKEFDRLYMKSLAEHNKKFGQVHVENLKDLYVTYRMAYDRLKEEDYIITYANGVVGVNKWFEIYIKSMKQFNDLCREFGLTPLSKASLEKKQNINREKDLALSEAEQKQLRIIKKNG